MDTILIIEDDQSIYAIIEGALSMINIQCIFAHNREVGLSLAIQQKPALILMDLLLPNSAKGWDVIAELKTNPITHGIPIIAFSATNNQQVQRALQAGALDFISKPFSITQFQRTITKYLHTAQC